MPTRSSGIRGERVRQVRERAEPQVRLLGALLQHSPGAAPDVDGEEAGGAGGDDVVVDPVADVCELSGLESRLRRDSLEERGGGLLELPARGRGDQIDLEP